MYNFEKLIGNECTFFNKQELIVNQKCLCLNCYNTFESKDIYFWADSVPLHRELEQEDREENLDYETIGTAVCPYCFVDKVIGEKQGFEINEEFIQAYINWEMEDDDE